MRGQQHRFKASRRQRQEMLLGLLRSFLKERGKLSARPSGWRVFGKTPKAAELLEATCWMHWPSSCIFVPLLGGWTKSLIKAGFKPKRRIKGRSKIFTRPLLVRLLREIAKLPDGREIISLQNWAAQADREDVQQIMKSLNLPAWPSTATVRMEFGTSAKIARAAGLRTSSRKAEAAKRRELCRTFFGIMLERHDNRYLTHDDYCRRCRRGAYRRLAERLGLAVPPSVNAVAAAIGGWEKGQVALGAAREESDIDARKAAYGILLRGASQWPGIDRIRYEQWAELGTRPEASALLEAAALAAWPNPRTVHRTFGTWRMALTLNGIVSPGRNGETHQPHWSDELLSALAAEARKHHENGKLNGSDWSEFTRSRAAKRIAQQFGLNGLPSWATVCRRGLAP